MTTQNNGQPEAVLPFIQETRSSWDKLKEEQRPIFIYGMGDGAIKIMTAMKSYGIPLAGIFASDEFVRGHSFEGYRVHKLSEVEEAVEDFVIVLAFAAGFQSLVDKIVALSQKHTLIVPDVPVTGGSLLTNTAWSMRRNCSRFTIFWRTISPERCTPGFSISRSAAISSI